MTETNPKAEELFFSDLSVGREIDQICDAFESSWKAGNRPALSAYLHDTNLPLDTLFLELVQLDIAYRIKSGEHPSKDEYAAQYPSFAGALDRLTMFSMDEGTANVTLEFAGVEPGLRYEREERLGTGGHGVVWKAYDHRLLRWVALKQFKEGTTESLRTLLKREARAIAQINHPNVVKVYDFGSDDEGDYIALELVSGGTLASWLQKQQPKGGPRVQLPPEKAARLAEQLANGLQAVHERHVVHRDFKPANVLLDEDEVPKIGDFGLARHMNMQTTIGGAGAVMGTVPYMSPEQCKSSKVDARSDLYSLGVVLYEMLTGRLPFQGTNNELLRDIPLGKFPLPSEFAAVPESLENICLRAMERDRDDRYQTAEALRADLQKFLEGEQVTRIRPGLATRGWRAVRKNLATAAIAIGTLGLASMALAWAVNSEEQNPDDGKWEVRIRTEPPGAHVVILPLDPLTGHPLTTDPELSIQLDASPASCRLTPGEYRVVAAIDSKRFSEVVRTVPRLGESMPFPAHYQFWKIMAPGVLQWDVIKIPEKPVRDEMILIPGTANAVVGKPGSSATPEHGVLIKSFYVSCREFNLNDYQKIRQGVPYNLQCDPPTGDCSISCRFDQAMQWAEDSHARLLTEEEFEYLAQLIDAQVSGQIEPIAKTAHAAGMSTDELNHSLGAIQELLSGQGEWVWGVPTGYRATANPELRERMTVNETHRVVKGRLPQTDTDRGGRDGELLKPSDRAVESYTTITPGIGFRLARSKSLTLGNLQDD
ncbi:serine/threonine protein kinase [Planctomicrobium piriforme]|uniref:Serine/threonine protein kinase n=1 Tax=Planctomicrobium piriforme TaxID=1576369 RepID=A0A1I3RWA4_9PLAN|nr:serine/threonine-protein kinase [Planctomicrobium piriforme]SFJ50320.1 serine/threonine protein kinase [Planctomicrobium piriforme]